MTPFIDTRELPHAELEPRIASFVERIEGWLQEQTYERNAHAGLGALLEVVNRLHAQTACEQNGNELFSDVRIVLHKGMTG